MYMFKLSKRRQQVLLPGRYASVDLLDFVLHLSTRMKLRVYRTLWGVLAEADGQLAESPFTNTEQGR